MKKEEQEEEEVNNIQGHTLNIGSRYAYEYIYVSNI